MRALESIFAQPVASLETKEQIERIKQWIRAHLEVEPDTVITVRQVECRAVACPGIETVIALLEYRRTRRSKVLKPLSEVQESDVMDAIQTDNISTQTYPPPRS